jgi:hypothetical protein
MKNYKIKATELYPGMDFYHVEGSGAYSGGEVIIHITKTPNMEETDEIGAKPAGNILVETEAKDGLGIHYLKPDDIVYPVIESKNVTIFTKLKWCLRYCIYRFL